MLRLIIEKQHDPTKQPMKPIKLTLITALCFATIFTACKKTDKALLMADATVINSGSQALDGCGWLIKIDNDFYSPTNLSEDNKVANKQVKINYYLLSSKFDCASGTANSLTGAKFSQIEIKTIVNK